MTGSIDTPCCSCGRLRHNSNFAMCVDCWVDVINAAYREHTAYREAAALWEVQG